MWIPYIATAPLFAANRKVKKPAKRGSIPESDIKKAVKQAKEKREKKDA